MNLTAAVGVYIPVLLGADLFNVQIPDWLAAAAKDSPSLLFGFVVFYLAFRHIAKSHQAPIASLTAEKDCHKPDSSPYHIRFGAAMPDARRRRWAPLSVRPTHPPRAPVAALA